MSFDEAGKFPPPPLTFSFPMTKQAELHEQPELLEKVNMIVASFIEPAESNKYSISKLDNAFICSKVEPVVMTAPEHTTATTPDVEIPISKEDTSTDDLSATYEHISIQS